MSKSISRAFFADGRADRPRVEGTVARGELRLDTHLYEGLVDGELASTFPYPVDKKMLERGRQRFDIFCQPCHGAGGDGDGMVVRRGFPAPPSLHLQRLADAPPGHMYDVITNGLGRMYGYADRVPVHDRWAIIGWISVLQRSRLGEIQEVPEADRAKLLAQAKP